MHPREFKDYWHLTRAELADLIGGYTVNGIQHWFRTENPIQPPQDLLNYLSHLHAVFSYWEVQRNVLPSQTWEIFELAYARRLEAEKKRQAEEAKPKRVRRKSTQKSIDS